MFNFIKNNLKKIYTSVTSNLLTIFSQKKISQETLQEIEQILITSDTGVATTKKIINSLQEQYTAGTITEGKDLQHALEKELIDILQTSTISANHDNSIFLLLGINGSGKTTFAGKLAHAYHLQGKRCLLAAADTFRAAAPEQLKNWAEQSHAEIFIGKPNQEPAAIAFGACDQFIKNNNDILIIDTAGRLQTKEHLMREITKIKKIIEKQLPNYKIHTLLTVDAMLGQNSFEQAKIFNEAAQVDGIILTKMDGTGKGGIIFSICNQLNIPIEYISYGEKIHDLKKFNTQEYVQTLVGSAFAAPAHKSDKE